MRQSIRIMLNARRVYQIQFRSIKLFVVPVLLKLSLKLSRLYEIKYEYILNNKWIRKTVAALNCISVLFN